MATKGVIPFLVAMMLVTGVCNTLLTKYQVRDCHCEDQTAAAIVIKPYLSMDSRTASCRTSMEDCFYAN
jgi:hypothetical protein